MHHSKQLQYAQEILLEESAFKHCMMVWDMKCFGSNF